MAAMAMFQLRPMKRRMVAEVIFSQYREGEANYNKAVKIRVSVKGNSTAAEVSDCGGEPAAKVVAPTMEEGITLATPEAASTV